MRKPFVAGNWKMHGSKAMIGSLISALRAGAEQIKGVDVAVCPPSLYIQFAGDMLLESQIKVGAQNVASVAGQGALTGEVSVDMVQDLGCQYVIVGHSERRSIFDETDEVVAAKVGVVLEAGLTPILCVGETLEQREAGVTQDVVAGQIGVVLQKLGVSAFNNIVIAYEPVWAIGTGKVATPEQAQSVHAFIRSLIANEDSKIASNLIIQYGGSVKPENAAILFSQPDIDGGLIGGASLDAGDFLAICKAAGEACSE
ncbi:triose-phosphate isomerase [Thiomicrospira microaerophila]|uniref:triose-phosphate isomerase n=1 Tax=Thiomicrospira microaerophila TaxID=406020 RepID=UPI00200D25CF|nr:triose-phosphate isomerase [Thiomicrospira microaerophila]UQB42861.1 triose-phosphate isomerase [Thiomicrospira microaerophila]